jgi:hypothetical protein
MTDLTDVDANVDSCIDDIVATCNGDLRGALKALMLVNEQLERELHRATALAMRPAAKASLTALH